MNESNINQNDNFPRNEFTTITSQMDIPFRFHRDNSINKINWINANLQIANENSDMNDGVKLSNNLISDNNELMIFPSISSGKSNNYFLQQNNSCNVFRNHRLSISLDTTQEKVLFSDQAKHSQNKHDMFKYTKNAVWNLKESRIQSNVNQSGSKCNFENKSDDNSPSDSETIVLKSNQYFQAQSILLKDIMGNRLVTNSVKMHKKPVSTACHSKPPLSPFINNSNGLLRSHKSILNAVVNQSHNKPTESKKIDSEVISVSSDNQCIEINDFESIDPSVDDGEMDLLDNIDLEAMDESSNKLINMEDMRSDSESPTEDMLKEVHRLVNTELIDSHLCNQPKSPFISSLFANLPPVIRFVREGESVGKLPICYQSMLTWRYSAMTPNVVKRAVKRSGFKLSNKTGLKWIGYFGSHMKASGFRLIAEHQKINHMPGSFQIGRKDRLWRNVTLLATKKIKTTDFNFLPKTYCLPADLKLLKGVWDDEESRRKAKWILKPPACARGIGVKVVSKWSQIPKKKSALIQSYISRPFLINESKFDLRVYVAVTSADPLRIYVYQEGLVRFASHKYSKSSKNMSNRFIHLTNYSVNKKSANYQDNEDHNKCQGHKWTLKTLWRHFEEDLKIDWKPIWKNIKDCVVKTIISVESHINSNIKMYCTQKNCVYELFGFDVLLDRNLKPWILEVNVSPSLHSNSPLDIEVKSSLISDLFNMVGFQLFQTPEETSQSLLPMSRRPSLSASSIPLSVSRSIFSSTSASASPDKKYHKAFLKQASLSSLNKIKLKKRSSAKSISDENEESLPINPSDELSQNLTNISLTDNCNSETTIIDNSYLQKRGYFTRSLTANEKSKHKYYIQKGFYDNPVILNTITDKLTVDDARIIIESVDELNRAGNFELSFPVVSEELDTYISYINASSGCRYYNCLLVEFMKKYKSTDEQPFVRTEPVSRFINSAGLKRLEKYTNRLCTESSIDNLWSQPVSKDIARSKLTLRSSSADVSTNGLNSVSRN